MKAFKCLVVAAAALGCATVDGTAASQTYSFSGSAQSYVVPEGVTSITATVKGGAGHSSPGAGAGGKGAVVTVTLKVTPGELLQIMVGGKGEGSFRAFNGGGYGNGGGGGASDIRHQYPFDPLYSCASTMRCGTDGRMVVAGAGGGGGAPIFGNTAPDGGDGGLFGHPGLASNNVTGGGDATPGLGGTNETGGAAGTGTHTYDPNYYMPSGGGDGVGGGAGFVAGAYGGGGGAGYYGGGGGGPSDNLATPYYTAMGTSGGGGGSSWSNPEETLSFSVVDGGNTGHGEIIISPPSATPNLVFGSIRAPQFFTVPADVSAIIVTLLGGGNSRNFGPSGDRIEGWMAATPGSILQVNVGEQGYGSDMSEIPAGLPQWAGGWNGGGQGGPGYRAIGGGGGGATDIRICPGVGPTHPCGIYDRIIVAAGGSGASTGEWGCGGGSGGGGQFGQGGNGGCIGGGIGANSTHGGVNPLDYTTNGAFFYGGNTTSGGGGGGGWYGGSGGVAGGGGGGSSYISATLLPGGANAYDTVDGASNPMHPGTSVEPSGRDGYASFFPQPKARTSAATVSGTTAIFNGQVNGYFLAAQAFVEVAMSKYDLMNRTGIVATINMKPVGATAPPYYIAGASWRTVISENDVTGDEFEPDSTFYARMCAGTVAGSSCSDDFITFVTPPCTRTATFPLPVGGRAHPEISSGLYNMGVLINGSVKMMGYGGYGQNGYGNSDDYGSSEEVDMRGVSVDFGGPVAQLSVSAEYATCALLTNGSVMCTGENSYGMLGNPWISTDLSYVGTDGTPVQNGAFVALPMRAVRIFAGYYSSCAVLENQRVMCWGYQGYGVLGIGADYGDQGDDEVLTHYAMVGGCVADVFAPTISESNSMCAVLATGKVRCWGEDTYISGADDTIGDDDMPSSVPTYNLTGPAASGAAGYEFACVVLRNGDMQCQGDDSYGQLANDPPSDDSYHPVPPANFSVDASGRRNLIKRVAGGNYHGAALTTGGDIHTWGYGGYGSLGLENGDDVYHPYQAVFISPFEKAVDLVISGDRTCIVMEQSQCIRCWGDFENYGEYGMGLSVDSYGANEGEAPGKLGHCLAVCAVTAFPLPVPATSIVRRGYGGHTCAIVAGEVICWGHNDKGQLGLGHTNSVGINALITSPVSVVTTGGLVSQIAVGLDHTCALLVNGSLLCFGNGADGAIGITPVNGTDNGDDEAPLSGGYVDFAGKRVISVGAGIGFTCVLLENNLVTCFGSNAFGVAGIGETEGSTSHVTPLQNGFVHAGGCVEQLTVRGHQVCVSHKGGFYTRCWGDNSAESMQGSSTRDGDRHPLYYPVLQLPNAQIVARSAVADVFGCGVAPDAVTVTCWGMHAAAYAPVNTSFTSPSPIAALEVAHADSTVSMAFACALTAQRRVFCWGPGSGVFSTPQASIEAGLPGAYVDVGGPVASLSCNTGSCCVTRYDNGGIVCWGDSPSAPSSYIGYPDTPSAWNQTTIFYKYGYVLPVPTVVAPRPTSANTGFAITVGDRFACAMVGDFGVMCWGRNSVGQLGYGNTNNVGDDETPYSVGMISLEDRVTKIDAGAEHACAVLSNGRFSCWGTNEASRLGYASSVVAVGDNELPTDVASIALFEGVASISAGWQHTCAVTTGGALVCFGNCTGGKCGYGDETVRTASTTSLPVFLPAGVVVAQVSAGNDHTCILSTAGAVYCFGGNEYGQLGYGDTLTRGATSILTSLTPVPLGGLASKVVAGSHTSCAIRKTTNDVVCWGRNDIGQLGLGHTLHNVGHNASYLPSAAGVVNLGGLAAKDIDLTAGTVCVAFWGGKSTCWAGAVSAPLGYGLRESGNFRQIGATNTPAGQYVDTAARIDTIAVGTDAGCGMSAGFIVCWGRCAEGQCGTGTTTVVEPPSAVPYIQLPVPGVPRPSPSSSPGAPPPPPSHSPTSSPIVRAVTMGLGVDGGDGDLIIDDEGGIATLLREAIAELAELPTTRVSITAVQSIVVTPNGTLSTNTSIRSNATINNGTDPNSFAFRTNRRLTSSSTSAVSQLRSRILANNIGASATCSVIRNTAGSNATRVVIKIAIAVEGAAFVAGEDPAMRAAAALARLFNTSDPASLPALASFAAVWSNCTGAPANLGVTAMPIVVYGVRVVDVVRPPAAEESGITSGGIAAAVLVPLIVLGCCFIAFCVWRRRRDQEEEDDAVKAKNAALPIVISSTASANGSAAAAAAASSSFSYVNPSSTSPSNIPTKSAFEPTQAVAAPPAAAADQATPKKVLALKKQVVTVTARVEETRGPSSV